MQRHENLRFVAWRRWLLPVVLVSLVVGGMAADPFAAPPVVAAQQDTAPENDAPAGDAAADNAAADAAAADAPTADAAAADAAAADAPTADDAAPSDPAPAEAPPSIAAPTPKIGPATKPDSKQPPAGETEPAGTGASRPDSAGPDAAGPDSTDQQADPAVPAPGEGGVWTARLKLLASLLAVVISIFIGFRLAHWLRLPDYGWRVALILLSITVSAIVLLQMGWPRLGIDLKGGVILVYEVDKVFLRDSDQQPQTEDRFRPADMDEMIDTLNLRINPGGQKAVVIRRYGSEQVEIIMPDAGPEEVNAIKDAIRRAGVLEFRITANERNFEDLRHHFRQTLQEFHLEASEPDAPTVIRAGQRAIAEWVPIRPEKADLNWQVQHGRPGGLIVRPRAATPDEQPRVSQAWQAVLREQDPGFKQMLELEAELGNISWEALSLRTENAVVIPGKNELRAASDYTERGENAVSFRMSGRSAEKLGQVTGDFMPDRVAEFYHKLGILFDGRLISAPNLRDRISTQGEISGGFTREEVSSLVRVLNAGSMRASLKDVPVSESKIAATLGEDTVNKGIAALSISLAGVLLFMLIYYRFAGVVACAALLMNLLLILAVVVLVQAELTLPGIAGLVLTVGMAVDANVLIYERIREELDRGTALRMAIRNGFDKAMRTIVDANLTTLITAIVLYTIGTEQIRGFAVILILGIAASMFTAIFCARTVFEVGERRRWVQKLSMMRMLSRTNINFVGHVRWAVAASLLVIAAGMVAIFGRGINLLDIDFVGGTSIHVLFNKSVPVDEVRKRLAGQLPDVTVSEVHVEDQEKERQYKIDTSLGSRRSVEEEFRRRDRDGDGRLTRDEFIGDERKPGTQAHRFAQRRFGELDSIGAGFLVLDAERPNQFTIAVDDVQGYWLEHLFEELLQRNSVKFDAAALRASAAPPRRALGKSRPLANSMPLAFTAALQEDGPAAASDTPAADAEAGTAGSDGNGAPSDGQTPAEPADPASQPADAATGQVPPRDAQAEPDADQPADPAAQPDSPQPGKDVPVVDRPAAPKPIDLTFEQPINESDLESLLRRAGQVVQPGYELRGLSLVSSDPDFRPGLSRAFKNWRVTIPRSPEVTAQILAEVDAQLRDAAVFPAANTIGGQVGQMAQQRAIMAIVFSLLAIIVYIWVRFQKVMYGLAAVVALVHDVLVTIGVLALSFYVAEYATPLATVLMIDAFKISLPVVAAVLTLIGYSLNDTIVVFDRIRDVRGKSPQLTADIINKSLNQTLSRTLLTAVTTLVVVLILYVMAGVEIHGFAFVLVVGVLVGTYSSIYVAAPILLWMTRSQTAAPTREERARAEAV